MTTKQEILAFFLNGTGDTRDYNELAISLDTWDIDEIYSLHALIKNLGYGHRAIGLLRAIAHHDTRSYRIELLTQTYRAVLMTCSDDVIDDLYTGQEREYSIRTYPEGYRFILSEVKH